MLTFDISITVELISDTPERIQSGCENLCCWFPPAGSAPFTVGASEAIQRCDQRLEDSLTQRQEVEFAFTPNLDQPCIFKLFDVVGERRRRYRKRGAGLRATHRASGFCDLLKKMETMRIGERLQDCGAPCARQPRLLAC